MLEWFFPALNSDFSPSLLPTLNLHATKYVQKSWWNHSLDSPFGSQIPNQTSWSSLLILMRFVQTLAFKSQRESISMNIFQFTINYNISHKIYKNIWNRSDQLVIYPVSVTGRFQISGEEDEIRTHVMMLPPQYRFTENSWLKFEVFLSKDLYFCTEKSCTIFCLQQLFGACVCFHTIFHTIRDKKLQN